MKTLYGLLGQSLGHSISPLIHRYIFEAQGLSAYYHLFELKKSCLKDAVTGLKLLGAAGVNVTIPYKTEVMKYLDYISPEAAQIGAVNTIAFRDQAAEGYNTDYYGFGMLLQRYGIGADGTEALILGYGGGAKAVVRFLLDNGAKKVTVAIRNAGNRVSVDPDHGNGKLEFVDFNNLHSAKGGNLVVNCTPVGMHPAVDNSPVPIDIISKYENAVDLIYNPSETLFLGMAKASGVKAVNGLYMLVGQAVAAHRIWNDIDPGQEQIDMIYDEVKEYMRKKV